MQIKAQSFATSDLRPAQAPPDWIVINAPRPLDGSELSGNQRATWEGKFHHGVHYAAVDPCDPEAARRVRENLSLDGWVVRYVTDGEIASAMETYCLENEIDRSDYEWEELRNTFLQLVWNQTISLDIPAPDMASGRE